MLPNPQRGTRHECRPRLDVEQLRSPTGDRVRTAHRGQNHRYTSRKRRITDLFKVRGDTIRQRIPPFPSHQPARIPDRNSIAHATRFSSTAFYPPGGQPGVFSTGLPARQIKRFTFGKVCDHNSARDTMLCGDFHFRTPRLRVRAEHKCVPFTDMLLYRDLLK